MGSGPEIRSASTPLLRFARLCEAMRRPSLLSQIVALNLLMVTAGILVAIIVGRVRLLDRRASAGSSSSWRWRCVLTFLLNTLLLRRRFEPLERLLAMMERVDLSRPGRRLEIDTEHARACRPTSCASRRAFNRMLERLENERRRSGELVIGAQEEERKRIARDLHDEVNQSLDRAAAAHRGRRPGRPGGR